MKYSKLLVLIAFSLVAVFLASFRDSEDSVKRMKNPHDPAERAAFKALADSLPDIFNGLFSTSGACQSCHGHDPDGLASVTPMGEDVNVVDAWRSTMMANSAKDPFWRAKMRHEILTNPQHEEEIGNLCTKCHAPLGRHATEFTGVESYTFEHMLTDTAGLDGVSCVACHQQSPENLGNTNSGELHFEQTQIAYGPYESPLVSPMALNSGYTPEYSLHIQDAGVCAGCHTLITGTIDLQGDPTGETFVEQATYHEWLNSSYAEQELNVSCQGCHMPDLGAKQAVGLAAGYDTPLRPNFSKHTLVGANTLMLSLMRDNIDTLGIYANTNDFDATIDATFDMLQQQSLDFELIELERDAESLKAGVVLENLAGHKFPSGYPARRLFVRCEVRDPASNDEVLWSSGEWDDSFYLIDEDETFEPHYDVITGEDQVQIYEMVMGDVNGDPTTVLERAAIHLKDNRLVPLGFTSESVVYDTTMIVGDVLADPNFNLNEFGMQGTATDSLFFDILAAGWPETVEVEISLWYQSIPPKWTEDLFTYDDPLINHFEELYGAADRSPVFIAGDSFQSSWTGVAEAIEPDVKLIPLIGGRLQVLSASAGSVNVYTLGGRLLAREAIQPGNSNLEMQFSSGVYLVIFSGKTGDFVGKVYFP